jgi:hypothetical protein
VAGASDGIGVGDELASDACVPFEHEVTSKEIATTRVALRTSFFIPNHQKIDQLTLQLCPNMSILWGYDTQKRDQHLANPFFATFKN